VPPQLALQSAVLVGEGGGSSGSMGEGGGDTMLVFGGSQHTHYKDERCYSAAVHAYNVRCNAWVAQTAPYADGDVGGAEIARFVQQALIFGVEMAQREGHFERHFGRSLSQVILREVFFRAHCGLHFHTGVHFCRARKEER
jgi:hypothetical protein